MAYRLTLAGAPRTKKNSQRIVMRGRYPKLLPSKAYSEYLKHCRWQLAGAPKGLSGCYNIRCDYYMVSRRAVDLVNLLEATMDILVDCGVLTDDNCNIVAGHDGSRVFYDKANPRVEITIEEVNGDGD